MDRMIPLKIGKQEHYLNFSIAVMFDAIDKFGSTPATIEAVNLPGREGYEAVKWLICRMAQEGELVRRNQGFSPEPFLSEESLNSQMSPFEYTRLVTATMSALTAGFTKEVEGKNEEVDLGLLELNEKKTSEAE